MKKIVPFEKLSKKEQKKITAKKRNGWNGVNPVTRKVESKKLYHRKRNPFGKEGADASCQTDFYFVA